MELIKEPIFNKVMNHQRLEYSVNLEQLAVDFEKVKNLVDDRNQVALNSQFGDPDPLYGFLSKRRGVENVFPIINAPFRGTCFEKLLTQLPTGFGQARIMRLKPRACYSIHKDSSFRFHLTLQTNPEAWFVLEGQPPFHIPRDGHIYRINTMIKHTAINGGNQDRYHLVIVDLCGDQAIFGSL